MLKITYIIPHPIYIENILNVANSTVLHSPVHTCYAEVRGQLQRSVIEDSNVNHAASPKLCLAVLHRQSLEEAKSSQYC